MLAGLFLSVLCPTDHRPSEPAPQPPEETRVAVRAERVILRPGQELAKATLLLERGVVVAVGTDVVVPEGTRVIEGAVACAGFVDPWSSLGLEPGSVSDVSASPATRSIDALDPWHLPEERRNALLAGVTAARVQAARGGMFSGLGALVHTVERTEPAVVVEDACLAGTIGVSRGGRGADIFDRLAEVDRWVGALDKGRRYRESQIDFRKELETWTKAIAEKLTELEKDFKKAKKDREKEEKDAKEKSKEFKEKKYKEDKKPKAVRRDVDDEVLARAVNGEIPLVVEVHRANEIRRLLDRTESFGRLRLVIAGGTEALAFADRLVERDVPVIVWPAPMGTIRPDEYEEHDIALAGALAQAGVRVLIGSGGGDEAEELRLLAALAVGHGMEREAALAAITSLPAEVFDADGRLGTLEPGSSGDVLVFDGDPLDTRSTLRAVVSRGEVVLP